MNRKLIISALAAGTLFMACGKEKTETPFVLDCTTPKSFSADVMPVIQSTCATNQSCHSTGSTQGVGSLTNYTQVFTVRFSIRDAIMTGKMPKEGSLTNAQKNAILCWIDAGAPNN